MFHPGLSCPGHAGIGFDFEYSIRVWYHGYTVGLYDAGRVGTFHHVILQSYTQPVRST